MKHRLFVIVAVILLMPMGLLSQTYETMWKQVEEAQQKDLPQTAMTHVEKIVRKAGKERAYGQLLKSTLTYAKLQAEIAPDSLLPAVKRLEQQEAQAQDVAVQAVYATVLSQLYKNNHQLDDDWQTRSQHYFNRATAHPEVLASVKEDGFAPFVIKGKDADIFSNDLLNVVGRELEAWQWLADFYSQHHGDMRARCAAALRAVQATRINAGRQAKLDESAYIHSLDSLILLYGSLPDACEIAIERYNYMDERTDATNEQKYAYLQDALNRWGTWKRANILRNAQNELTCSSYMAELSEINLMHGQSPTVKLKLRSLQGLNMRVYKTNLQGDTDLNPEREEDYTKMKPGLQELKEWGQALVFSGHADYDWFEDSLSLKALPVGVYMVEFSSQPATNVSRHLCFVSNVRLMSLPMPGNRMRYVVVDAQTGQPIGGAKVRLAFNMGWKKPKKYEELTCDANGEATYTMRDNKHPERVFAFTSADQYCPEQNGYGRYYYYARQYSGQHVNLFTDRSIYRPGQTVHATAIVWQEVSVLDNKAVCGKNVQFELRDANYKVVAEQQATTDDYGKCAVDFTLPQGLLNGRFTIRANGNSVGFRVEEYKRPTFQVEFPDYKESYQAGDIVRAQAKAVSYAGVPVQGAKVKYTVERRVAYWWMSYSRYWQGGYVGSGLEAEVVNEGETVTADDGTFTVEMPMKLPAGMGYGPMFYNFVVEADVTDVAGETHSGTLSLPLGSKPTALTCDLAQQVRRDQLPKVTFARRNAAGKEIAGTVKYCLDNGKWQTCAANTQCAVFGAQCKSGEHRLQAVCENDSIDVKFVVFSLDDTKPATQTDDWFYVSDSQFPQDGKPITVQVGSSDADLHIVYALFAGDKMIESGAAKKSGELLNRKFTYQEEYGNGLLMTFAWVKNGQCHIHQQTISRPMPDKQLRLTWETFRDRLTPGQQEEWRLKIQNPDGTPANASLLAVLYDKSLDQIQSHQWSFMPAISLSYPSTAWQWQTLGGISLSGSKNYTPLAVPAMHFSRFDDSVYPQTFLRMMVRGNARLMKAAAPQMEMPVAQQSAGVAIGAFDVKSNDEAAGEVLNAKDTAAEERQQEQDNVPLRENLQETAFCYPALTTDAKGQVTLKFTLPESLTTWRMMGVANTPQMLYGSIDGEAVAQKDVMVQPNVPRFLRMGDQATLTARIFNTSEKQVSGKARLMLIDPECDRTVYEQELPFSILPGQTDNVGFPFQPDETYSLLICKVTAAGDGFSDGEQHYLPILPDREFVTKTVPYTQHEPGVKTVDLTRLFPVGTTQQKLTVEYTNNPAWLMVQSLPTVGQPWEHSAIEQAASYYSNALALSLLKQSPQVKTTFELWKRENLTSPFSPLTSQLEKDQELKDLVLAETPWVWAADRESEQKQRLADFFDENGINHRLAMAVEKLKKLQNADGSFSWYPGIQGSTMVTVTVEEMLARLCLLAGSQSDVTTMQTKAFNYIGREMVDLVNDLKKQEKKGQKPSFPSFTALRWLYVCAIDGRALTADVKSANDYLVKLLKKDTKNQSIYEKALTAVILSKGGDAKLAQQYVQSLKEYTVFTEEMGRYYDTPRAGYSWFDYKIPTEVAALEAIQMVAPADRQTVDEMRRWLLQEKRTQAWDTPINSVNAIYAFLNGNQKSLDVTGSATILALDGKPVELPKATAGLGYVKTAIASPSAHTFTATKSSEGTSWGAVYAQFMQKTSDVEASQSGITVKRELLSANGQKLSANSLTVGDRIRLRITIETTRDLDFVQVVDRRAACMEPVRQLSGYQHGAYVSPKDQATHYFYYGLPKGKHVIETEYYIDRAGQYETGTCTAGCAYAPEYRATAPSMTFNVK